MTLCGILNVNKPAGWSSRGVVNRVEGITRKAHSGHAGTLDPLATGVLVVCVGQATRLIQYIHRTRKCYHATFVLGRSSLTDDTTGDVRALDGAPQPTREAVEAALLKFLGQIEQRPPTHSAVKFQGRRAYKLARAGQSVELPPRVVTVHRLEVLRYEYPELKLDVECGSGTYVRALGRDLAASLGTAGVMSALVRTAVGCFRVEHAVPLNELNDDTLSQHLQPPLTAAVDLPRIQLNEAELVELRFGRSIAKPCDASPGDNSENEWAAVDSRGRLAAILYEKYPGQLWPVRNFAS